MRYGEDAAWIGDRVLVYWGQARGCIGRVESTGLHAVRVVMEKESRFDGLFTVDSLRKIVDSIPKFNSRHELEDWLDRAGDQDYLRGDVVRVSVERWYDKEIRYGRIVNYLGISGNDPPQYSVAFEDQYTGEEEVKIVSYYFIHGLARP